MDVHGIGLNGSPRNCCLQAGKVDVARLCHIGFIR